MTPVLLDTSGLLARVNRAERSHAQAKAVWRGLLSEQRPLVTTSLVLIECGDGLSRVNQRHLAVALRDSLLRLPNLRNIHTTEELEQRAWTLFQDRTDKDWGMTDCVSMTVMWDESITEVFGLDRHFQQAGFQLLLN